MLGYLYFHLLLKGLTKKHNEWFFVIPYTPKDRSYNPPASPLSRSIAVCALGVGCGFVASLSIAKTQGDLLQEHEKARVGSLVVDTSDLSLATGQPEKNG